MRKANCWYGATLVICLALLGPNGLQAQAKPGQKPAQTAPAKPPATPAAPATRKPATPAPQARAVRRTDIVNPETEAAFNTGDRIAIVAGIGSYGNELAPLQYTMADAVELSSELRRQGYTVFTMLNKQATAENIRQRLKALGGNKPGMLVFAFAGHGFQGKAGGNYLATYGTTVEALEEEGLPVAEVQTLMKETGAKQSVLLLDACRNLPGTRAVTSAPTFRDFSNSEGVRLLLSTRPGGFSYEDPTLEHGIFTHFVIEGLRGKAANTADGKITFEDLANYVEKNVFGYAASKDIVQKPFRSGEASGDFLLATAAVLKAEEVEKVREESGSKNLTNDAVLATRQGTLDNFMMIHRDSELVIRQAPTMLPYATLKKVEAKDLPAGHERYEGPAGKGDLLMHVVVRMQGGRPVELFGRVGTECKTNCAGQDLRLPGETAAASSVIGKAADLGKAAGGVLRIFGGGKTADQVNKGAAASDQVAKVMASRSWTAFNLVDQEQAK
jgi:hypothetical protein